VTAGPVRVAVAGSPAEIAAARALEHDVFAAEGFIPAGEHRAVEEYGYLDGQSRWLVAERDGVPVGVLRLIADRPHVVPAIAHFPPLPGAHEVLAGERYAEVGTLAVAADERGGEVGLLLYRAALQLSLREGVTAWVAVLEQWLLEHMAASGFHFTPMSRSRYYMGGDCLSVRMVLRDALGVLQQQDAGRHAWMVRGLPGAVAG